MYKRFPGHGIWNRAHRGWVRDLSRYQGKGKVSGGLRGIECFQDGSDQCEGAANVPTLSDSAILLAVAVAAGWETEFDVTSVSCDDCPYQPQCPPTCDSLNPEIALWVGQWIMKAEACLTHALTA